MEFRLLGPVEAGVPGLPVELGGPRERALLARLLLSANYVVPADRIAEDLWSGDPPPRALATLRVYVSRLRRALGDDAADLVTQPPGYRLMVGDDNLDVARFERLVAAGDAELGAGRPDLAADLISQALTLWRGPALADVADLSFAHGYATRLEEARTTALEAWAEAELRCGRHAALVAELEELSASHPMRERFWGQLILALYRCDRQADALAAFARLRRALAEELGIDPSAAICELHERVLRHDSRLDWQPAARGARVAGRRASEQDRRPSAPPASGPPTDPSRASIPALGGSRLPHETTSFIGREQELATIDELLGLSRLLTLTGPGGSGKSRLALRSAARSAGRFPGGAWLVELAAVARSEVVAPAVAAALSVTEEPGKPLTDTIAARLGGGETLLVLDNCEQILDDVAALVSRLLRLCPALRVLATSQIRLGVDGEAIWPVQPLAVPEPAAAELADIKDVESVRLLCDRAALARRGFALTAQNAADVADICRRLDGIPLAIELAAARFSALSAQQLAARIDDRFQLLTGGSRMALPRHRALVTAIDWSHDLLSREERVCFRRLAVFRGGCTLEAAEAVCPDAELPLGRIFDTVSSLVDKSLLSAEERLGTMRYGMLESIHSYAARRMTDAAETDWLQDRHVAWLLDYAAQADLDGPDQGAWLDLIEADLDNFRSALERQFDAPAHAMTAPASDGLAALALTGLLDPFWMVRGPVSLGRRWLDQALAAAGPDADPRLRALALDGAGQLAHVHADNDAQLAYQEQSLAIWRGLGDIAKIAACLSDLGTGEHIRGDFPTAQARYAEALELAGHASDDKLVALCLNGLGKVALHQNDLAQAAAHFRDGVSRARAAGDVRQAALILGNLGVVALHQGDLELARASLQDQLDGARLLGDRKLAGGALTNLGTIVFQSGDLDAAATLQHEAVALAEQIGDRRLAAVAFTNLGIIGCARRDYGSARTALRSSLGLASAVGEPRATAECLEELALVEAASGQRELAATLLGAADVIRDTMGAPIMQADADRVTAGMAALEEALGAAAYAAAHAIGRALSVTDAVALAMAMADPATSGARQQARSAAVRPAAAAETRRVRSR